MPDVQKIVRAWPNPQTLIINREPDARSNERSAPGSPFDVGKPRDADRTDTVTNRSATHSTQ